MSKYYVSRKDKLINVTWSKLQGSKVYVANTHEHLSHLGVIGHVWVHVCEVWFPLYMMLNGVQKWAAFIKPQRTLKRRARNPLQQ